MTTSVSESDVEEIGRVTRLAFSRVGKPFDPVLAGEIIREVADLLERRDVRQIMPLIPGT